MIHNENQAKLGGYVKRFERGHNANVPRSIRPDSRTQATRRPSRQDFGETNQPAGSEVNVPATKRQVEWLIDLGAPIPEELTKQEASVMIGELTGQA